MDITDAMVEAAVRAYDKNQPFEASVCDSSRMRAALTAAIGAGGQAVAWQYEAEVNGQWTPCLGRDHPIDRYASERDRQSARSQVRNVYPLYTHPAPSGQAVVVKDWITVAKSAGTHGIRYRTNAALEKFLTEILSALSKPHPADERVVEALRHPLEAYADSYAQMARMGDGNVDCRSVEVDIRQNMIPVTRPLSAKEGR